MKLYTDYFSYKISDIHVTKSFIEKKLAKHKQIHVAAYLDLQYSSSLYPPECKGTEELATRQYFWTEGLAHICACALRLGFFG